MLTLSPATLYTVLLLALPMRGEATPSSTSQHPSTLADGSRMLTPQAEELQRSELQQYNSWLGTLEGSVLPADASPERRAAALDWRQRLWVAAEVEPQTALGIECRVQLVALLNECQLHADSEQHVLELIRLDRAPTMASFWKAELSEVRLLRLSGPDGRSLDASETRAIQDEARLALETEVRAAETLGHLDPSFRTRYLGVLLGYGALASRGICESKTACARLLEGYEFSRRCVAANLDVVGRTPEHFACERFDLVLRDDSASPEEMESSLAELRKQDVSRDLVALRFRKFLGRRYKANSPELVERARQFLAEQGEQHGIQVLVLRVEVATLLMHAGDSSEALRLTELFLGSTPVGLDESDLPAWKALQLVGGLVHAASAQIAGDETLRLVAVHHLLGLMVVGFESEEDIALRIRDFISRRPR